MLFNSLQFAIFFTIVYSLYLVLNHKWQNRMLLIASYIFYGSWDYRFLSLIVISTVLDYFCGLKIDSTEDIKTRKRFLFLSVLGNLGVLGIFKYCNFFTSNLQHLMNSFGFQIPEFSLAITLPVGISFYTFQTMSYTIDIYRKELKPTRGFLDFALFVAYFPQLVAGPIERAKHLLPQVVQSRQVTLTKFYEGCYLIFWGLFQKVFVADNLALYVDTVFGKVKNFDNAFEILFVLYAFSFQIFCDFAGYSNIARGLSKCMGFEIMVNFNLPYFSTNPREFWRRWHISLSTWLRDYLYIPLGGNKKGANRMHRNLAITMLLGGLWHGASWTFIAWGAYHGLLLMFQRLIESIGIKTGFFESVFAKKMCFALKIIIFFHITCIGWLIFRAQSFPQLSNMFYALCFQWEYVPLKELGMQFWGVLKYIFILLAVQVWQYSKKDLMIVYKSNVIIKAIFYYVCFICLIIFGVTGAKEFIYFQF